MIGSGISTTLNIISNTAKTIENCSEMMCKATTQMNEAMYNKLSPEAKAEFDARMAELHINVSKDKTNNYGKRYKWQVIFQLKLHGITQKK